MERVVRGAYPEEIGDVARFCERLMGATREYFESRFMTTPHAKSENSRIVLVGDAIAAHIRTYRRDLRLRGSVISVGTLSEVCTDPDYRRQGHGRALLKDCAEYNRLLGFPISIVWSGVTEFYSCENWVRFPLISTSLSIPYWRMQPASDIHIRRFRRGEDDSAVSEIYEEYNKNRSLSVIRDKEYWRLHHSWIRTEDEDGFLVAEKQDRLVGYCRASGFNIMEYGVLNGHEDAGPAIVDAMVRRARARKHLDTISLNLPVDEKLITQFPKIRYKLSINEGLMFRVIDLKGVLSAALHNAEDRLREIGFSGKKRISLEVLDQKCTLHFSDGKVTVEESDDADPVVVIQQEEFIKLIFGSNMEKDLSGFSLEEQHFLNDLFPPDGPVYWGPDMT